MICKRFKLVSKSEDEWENKVIEYFFKRLQRKEPSFPKTEIHRITNQGAPDFYATGFNSVLEIKKVTDSEEKAGKYAGSRNGRDRLTKELNELNPYINTLTSAHIIIPGWCLIKDRGKDFDKLKDNILKSLKSREETGSAGEVIYRIEYLESTEFSSVLIPIHGMDVDYLSYEDLREPIKLRIKKANHQLKFVPENLPSGHIRILILCQFGTRSKDPNDIKQNVFDLLKEIPEIFQNIDRIYILGEEEYFEIINIR